MPDKISVSEYQNMCFCPTWGVSKYLHPKGSFQFQFCNTDIKGPAQHLTCRWRYGNIIPLNGQNSVVKADSLDILDNLICTGFHIYWFRYLKKKKKCWSLSNCNSLTYCFINTLNLQQDALSSSVAPELFHHLLDSRKKKKKRRTGEKTATVRSKWKILVPK